MGNFELSGVLPRAPCRAAGRGHIDTNGIPYLSASDKATGKLNRVIITNHKGRLFEEEIGRMVNETEKHRSGYPFQFLASIY